MARINRRPSANRRAPTEEDAPNPVGYDQADFDFTSAGFHDRMMDPVCRERLVTEFGGGFDGGGGRPPMEPEPHGLTSFDPSRGRAPSGGTPTGISDIAKEMAERARISSVFGTTPGIAGVKSSTMFTSPSRMLMSPDIHPEDPRFGGPSMFGGTFS